jgi:hypothetical protein
MAYADRCFWAALAILRGVRFADEIEATLEVTLPLLFEEALGFGVSEAFPVVAAPV